MKLNNNTRGIFVIVISLSLITALTSITYLSSTPVLAIPSGDQQKFTAQLSGDQEVPPILSCFGLNHVIPDALV